MVIALLGLVGVVVWIVAIAAVILAGFWIAALLLVAVPLGVALVWH